MITFVYNLLTVRFFHVFYFSGSPYYLSIYLQSFKKLRTIINRQNYSKIFFGTEASVKLFFSPLKEINGNMKKNFFFNDGQLFNSAL